MSESAAPVSPGTGARKGKRGLSTKMAIVILVVVTIVVGLGGYAGLQSISATKTTKSYCAPASKCASTFSPNDVSLYIPCTAGAGQPYSVVAAGASVSASVGVSGGETIQSFSVTWGPGQTTSNSTGLSLLHLRDPGVVHGVRQRYDSERSPPYWNRFVGGAQGEPERCEHRCGVLPHSVHLAVEHRWRTVPLDFGGRVRHCERVLHSRAGESISMPRALRH